MEKNELQEKDIKILDAIRYDARKPYEQVAKEVGLSRTAVKSRIDAMVESGIIQGFETKVRSSNIGQASRFFMDVETNPRDFESVKNYLGNSSFITELYIAAGSCHLHAVGMASNQATMQAFVNKVQRDLCEVRRLSIYGILSVCKDVDGGVEYGKEDNLEES